MVAVSNFRELIEGLCLQFAYRVPCFNCDSAEILRINAKVFEALLELNY